MSNIPVVPCTPPAAHQAYDYTLFDVFAEQPLQGNQLAVFCDARGLTTEEMQAIAREMNLSETTFIIPRPPEVERERGVQVRIFTVREELRFAGHPTLGSACCVHLNHPAFKGSDKVVLDLPIGPIPVTFAQQADALGFFASMRQNDPVFGTVHEAEPVARALGLQPDDLDLELPIQTVSTGMPFCIVPLRSLEVAARLSIPEHSARPYLANAGARFFYCVVRADPASGADWHARMQFYNGEDPATGSAAGCAISYLVEHSVAPSGHQVVIEQGVEILRPSRIYAQAKRGEGRIFDVFISGRTIPIANGRIFLP